jgi:hypothetical protein
MSLHLIDGRQQLRAAALKQQRPAASQYAEEAGRAGALETTSWRDLAIIDSSPPSLEH